MKNIVVDASKYETMTFRKVTCFEAGDVTMKFIPANDLPGYSYRVVAMRNAEVIGHSWMGEENNPTHKNAEFFYNTIVNGVYQS
jgi:hypothetical protein